MNESCRTCTVGTDFVTLQKKKNKNHTAMAKKTEKIAATSTQNQPKKLSKIGNFMESVKGKKIGEIYDMRAVLR